MRTPTARDPTATCSSGAPPMPARPGPRPSVSNDVPQRAKRGPSTRWPPTLRATCFLAWLDHRTGKGTTLYGARSSDAGTTWFEELPGLSIARRNHLLSAATPPQRLRPTENFIVMWRNWLEGSRDMYLARSRAGAAFGPAEKLGMGTWKLKGCPMDGGGCRDLPAAGIHGCGRREGTVYRVGTGRTRNRARPGKRLGCSSGPQGSLRCLGQRVRSRNCARLKRRRCHCQETEPSRRLPSSIRRLRRGGLARG